MFLPESLKLRDRGRFSVLTVLFQRSENRRNSVRIGLLLPPLNLKGLRDAPLNLKGLRDEIRAEDCSEKRQRGSDQEW